VKLRQLYIETNFEHRALWRKRLFYGIVVVVVVVVVVVIIIIIRHKCYKSKEDKFSSMQRNGSPGR
jgi:cytochrome c oxidase assembly factor CtaG